MLFNSIEYIIFLPVVFLMYWFVFERFISKSRHQLKLQNAFVVLASYVFYGWWNWRFLLLIAFTSFCSWSSGLLIAEAKSPQAAKAWMWANIVVNLCILALFKYGLLPNVVLPVGISFYTFQALSYSIDVCRGKMAPTKDAVAFFAFLSFFPQLVAGPIERATHFMPQILKRRQFNFDLAIDGARQLLWGLFKKIVVADNCAIYVDRVFADYPSHSGSTLLLAAVLFTFQIYGDFSGYSDMAIGTAKLFGIRLMRNFNQPYFSRDIAEFWRKWHISLTTWFRDYVYIPMGGSRVTTAKVVRNTLVVFLLSGCWHGSNWTFLAWGAYHVMLFLPLILMGRNRRYTNQIAEGRPLPTLKEVGQMVLTFLLVMIGWVVFRSESIVEAWEYLCGMADPSLFTRPFLMVGTKKSLLLALMMLVLEWMTRDREHALQYPARTPWWVAGSLTLSMVLIILEFAANGQSFIYFQF